MKEVSFGKDYQNNDLQTCSNLYSLKTGKQVLLWWFQWSHMDTDLVSGFMCSKMYRSFLCEMLKYAAFGQLRITRKIKRQRSLKKLWPLHFSEVVSTPFCQVGRRGHRNMCLPSEIQILNQKNLQQSHQGSLLHLN